MRILALTILLISTECNAQVKIFRAATKRPSAAVVDVSRTQHTETTPAADISELLKKRGEVIQAHGEQRLRDKDYYLCFYSASWCTFCHAFERSEEYARIKAAYGVTTVDYDTCPREWKAAMGRIPALQLRRVSDRKLIRQWIGRVTLQQIDEARHTPPAQPVPVNNGVAQAELIQLHNRLHGGGQWTWPGNLRDHLRTVHGVAL